jgi:hypothetical protein
VCFAEFLIEISQIRPLLPRALGAIL